eukprot:m.102997 g.102997  ORF g.102997 m.102997 type:complete len:821 (-) comp20851_c0_seq1:39-2501(-)
MFDLRGHAAATTALPSIPTRPRISQDRKGGPQMSHASTKGPYARHRAPIARAAPAAHGLRPAKRITAAYPPIGHAEDMPPRGNAAHRNPHTTPSNPPAQSRRSRVLFGDTSWKRGRDHDHEELAELRGVLPLPRAPSGDLPPGEPIALFGSADWKSSAPTDELAALRGVMPMPPSDLPPAERHAALFGGTTWQTGSADVADGEAGGASWNTGSAGGAGDDELAELRGMWKFKPDEPEDSGAVDEGGGDSGPKVATTAPPSKARNRTQRRDWQPPKGRVSAGERNRRPAREKRPARGSTPTKPTDAMQHGEAHAADAIRVPGTRASSPECQPESSAEAAVAPKRSRADGLRKKLRSHVAADPVANDDGSNEAMESEADDSPDGVLNILRLLHHAKRWKLKAGEPARDAPRAKKNPFWQECKTAFFAKERPTQTVPAARKTARSTEFRSYSKMSMDFMNDDDHSALIEATALAYRASHPKDGGKRDGGGSMLGDQLRGTQRGLGSGAVPRKSNTEISKPSVGGAGGGYARGYRRLSSARSPMESDDGDADDDGDDDGHGHDSGKPTRSRRMRPQFSTQPKIRRSQPRLHVVLEELNPYDASIMDFLSRMCLLPDWKIQAYQTVFDSLDKKKQGGLDPLQLGIGLTAICGHSLTNREIDFVAEMLDLSDPHRDHNVTFEEFTMAAALSEHVVDLEETVRAKINPAALISKKRKAMLMFFVDAAEDCTMHLDDLQVLLDAGRVDDDQQQTILDRLVVHGDSISFMEYLAYLPLFLDLHDDIVANTFHEERRIFDEFDEEEEHDDTGAINTLEVPLHTHTDSHTD